MYPEDMATALVHMLQQPANMVTDELLIHPLGQDY
jgi:NADP-dependent 3-hydroxy acid dehydrogenase YdfG